MAGPFRQALAQRIGQQAPGPQENAPVAGADPITMLMEEYKKLEATTPAPSAYSPQEQTQRVQQNDDQMALGVLGQASGDRALSPVGGQVLRQAMLARAPVNNARGTMDPLTGIHTVDPGYTDARNENRRGQILQQALHFQDRRMQEQSRAEMARDSNNVRAEIAGLKAEVAAGGRTERPHNLQVIEHPITGEKWWADPRTGDPVKPVTIPGAGNFVKPEKMTSSDEKAFSGLTQEKAAVLGGLQALQKQPNAFGFLKGAPNLATGAAGTIGQTLRDKALSRSEIAARAYIYNNVSAVIKERAGTAQSAGELQMLRSFLPSPIDDARAIESKLSAYTDYLETKEAAIRSRYTHDNRVVSHLPGTQPVAAGPGSPAGPQASPVGGATPALPAAAGGLPPGWTIRKVN